MAPVNWSAVMVLFTVMPLILSNASLRVIWAYLSVLSVWPRPGLPLPATTPVCPLGILYAFQPKSATLLPAADLFRGSASLSFFRSAKPSSPCLMACARRASAYASTVS